MSRLHPGQGWLLCYASGGCTLPGYEDHDRYYASEPAISGSSFPDKRMLPYKVGNNELSREAARHGRDVAIEEALEKLSPSDSAKLAAAVKALDKLGVPIILWTHRLNRFHAEGHEGPEDPLGLVVGFPTLPALDRALGKLSGRRSIRKFENFPVFLLDPDGALRAAEAASVEEGFHVDLKAGSHSSETINKNAANLGEVIASESDEKVIKKVVTIGSLFSGESK